MITLQDISLQLGDQWLLDHTDLTIYVNDRIGFIGRNGTGKTSLFKLLMGDISPDTGSYHRPDDWRIALMRQESSAATQSALDFVLDGHEDYRRLEALMAKAEAANDGIKLGELYDQWEHINGYSLPSQAMQLLNGLGFADADQSKPMSAFSGGWRVRLNLAQALMSPSDLLLLDEPTNHLDVDATLWLERWLLQYQGTLIIVSHDRDFLDAIVTRIVHIDQRKLSSYKGNYSQFEQQLSLRLAEQAQAFDKQQQTIAHLEDFIRRFKAKATKAKQAQSRVKALDRMEKIAPLRAQSPFSFRFQAYEKMSSPLVHLQEVSAGYRTPVLEKLNLSLLPEAKVGLLGANGQGKSTLIKSLLGTLPALEGERHTGEHCRIGYFSQHQQEALDLSASPLQILQRQDPTATDASLRTFLGQFAFNNDRVFETIADFSGGEKARLALALIAWQKPNVLLMDEPTNHLDMTMREALAWAIQEFEGALLLISHDRHLLKSCCDEFWWVHNGRCQPFDGSLDDYQAMISQLSTQTTPSASGSGHAKKAQRKEKASQRANTEPLRRSLKKAEREMEQWQATVDTINERLTDNSLYEAANQSALAKLLKEQGAAQQQLEAIEAQWLELTEQMEQACEPDNRR
ncbi:ATP-binding cassette domain-containing protein [bacterium]|nr:ATP-binding cassette domain-containing protein [bacterium]